jgi:hypothetical protein
MFALIIYDAGFWAVMREPLGELTPEQLLPGREYRPSNG